VYAFIHFKFNFDRDCVHAPRFNLNRYLGAQPLQIMGKHGAVPHGGSYLFNIEMWHESLVGPWHPERNPAFGCL
jgi:hypothetical protein